MNLPEQFVEFLNSQQPIPSPATVKNYKADVSAFINWFETSYKKAFDPASVNTGTIEQFKKDRMNQVSAVSVDRYLSSLRKFFNFLKLEGINSKDPFEAIQNLRLETLNSDPFRLRDFKNYLYVYNASPLTIKNYIMDVNQFMQWAQQVTNVQKQWQVADKNIFDKVNWKLLEEYKLRLVQEHFSPLSINRKLSSIRKYIAWAEEEGLIKRGQQEVKPKETGLFSAIPQAAPKTNYIPVPQRFASSSVPAVSVESEATAELPKQASVPSKIPPVRLVQKTINAGDWLFDAIFIEPLALLITGGREVLWKIKGKPVFESSKNNTAKGPTQVYNIKKEFYSPISTNGMALHQKTWHHLRHTRPDWYRKYHSYAFVHYLHFGALIILMSLLGFFIFKNVNTNTSQFTQLAQGNSTKRTLVFQGKLADSKGNSITGQTQVKFSIYDAKINGGSIWTETDSINPNSDGTFSVVLGNKTPLYQDLFVKTYTLWLGIAIGGDPELVPRQQLANVALSENSQTLQGLPPITQSKVGTNNVVLALDSSGNLTIGGQASSTFQAIGGQFTLSGNVLSLTTVAGTNSNIILAPDGLGKVDIQKPIYNSSNSSSASGIPGAVEIADNTYINASSSAYPALTINQNGTSAIISASSSGVAKFNVDALGNTTIAGDLIVNGKKISAPGLTDLNFGNSSLTIGAINTNGNFSQTGSSTFSTGSGSATLNGDVTLGSSSSNTITFTGRVAKNSSLVPITTTGASDLGAANFPWSTLYVKQVVANSSDGQQGWWQRNLSGDLAPFTTTDNLAIGASSVGSAKFSVLGASGNTTINGTLTASGAATLSSTLGVTGAATLSSTLGVTGATTLSSTLGVTGATTLSSTLAVTGNTTLTGNLAVNGGSLTTTATTFNLANTTATTLNIGGAATTIGIGVSGGTTTINGNLTVSGVTTTNGNVALGSGVSNTVTFNGVVNSNIVPSATNAFDLGSASKLWANGYFTNVNATNISGTVTGGSTTSQTWLINSGNATNNAQISALAYSVGTAPINNVIQWNAVNDTVNKVAGFDNTTLFNYPIGIFSQVSGVNQTFTSGTLFKYSQPSTHAITQSGAFTGVNIDFSSNITVPNSSSGNQTGISVTLKDGGASATATGIAIAGTGDYALTTSSTAGNVGIGTTSPAFKLDVQGTVNASTGINAGGNTTTPIAGDVLGVLQIKGVVGNNLNIGVNSAAVVVTNNLQMNGGTIIPTAPQSMLIQNAADNNGSGQLKSFAYTAMTAETVPWSVKAQTLTITGSYATQRFWNYEQPTISAASALTITNADTVSIAGAPTVASSALITNAYGLRIVAGAVAAGVTNAYGLSVSAPTGATNNYAAVFPTGNVGIGTTAPTSLVHVSGAVAGKALGIFNYTGTDQNILVASQSGTLRFSVGNQGNITVNANTSVDDYTKTTTADFTVSGSTTTNVNTTGDEISQNLGTAAMTVSAGTALSANAGAGAHSFQRADGQFVVILGGAVTTTNLYDPVGNTFTAGSALSAAAGAGAHSFQRADGQFITILGNASTTTNIYNPATNTFTAGTALTAAAGAGAHSFQRADGKFIVILGNASTATNIYDPATNTFSAGLALTAAAGAGAHSFQRPDGKFVVILGNASTTTNIYDPLTGTFTAGTALTAAAGAGAHSFQRPDGKYVTILGNVSTTTNIYDISPSAYTFSAGPALSAAAGAGAHSFQRPDGKWIIILGNTSGITNLYDPVANTFTASTALGANAAAGAFSLQRTDGKYAIILGNASTTTKLIDAGWATTGNWTSENIDLTGKLSTSSAVLWKAAYQNSTNPSRIDPKNIKVEVKVANTTGNLASASYVVIENSGDNIPMTNPANAIAVKVSFNIPIPANPSGGTFPVVETNVWGGESSAFYFRSFAQPALFEFTIKNPITAKGGPGALTSKWATQSATLTNLDTDNSNNLRLAFNKNNPIATASAQVATGSALVTNVAYSGSHSLKRADGKFVLVHGSGFLSTNIYDPATNAFTAGPDLTAAISLGGHSFQRQDGKFVTILGNSTTTTNIYNPATNTFSAGPNLPQNANDGAHTVQLPNGKFLTILANATGNTAIYDPNSNTFTQGPYLVVSAIAASGSFSINLGNGRFLTILGNGTTTTNIYDFASNSFLAGPALTAAANNGAHAFQRADGKFVVIRGGGTTGTNIYDPIANSFSAGPALSANAQNGSHSFQMADGRFFTVLGNLSTTTNIYNPDTNTFTAGPALPVAADWGAHSFQTPDGRYISIAGNNTNGTAVIDVGWVFSGTYVSEPITSGLLNANTALFWKTLPALGGTVAAKVRSATTALGLSAASWSDAPTTGTAVNSSANSWIQVRFDLSGTISSYPGAQKNVWVSSGGGGVVAYYRTPVSPALVSYELSTAPAGNLIAINSNNSTMFRFTADGSAYTSQNGAWYAGGADFAEYYQSNQKLQPGEIVAVDPNNAADGAVIRSSSPYQKDILGVVSTKPGFVAGAYTEGAFPIALIGRVPLLVSNINGDIKPGDLLTSSQTPGVAMKATQAGQTIGKALTGLSEKDCKDVNVSTASAIFLENKICTGTITVFVNVSYNDPTPFLITSAQDLKNFVFDTAGNIADLAGNTFTKAEVLANAAIGNLRAGIINTQQLIAVNITADKIISPIAEVDRLKTNLISPLASSSAIAIKLSDSKVSIINTAQATPSAVASFDNQGNATFSGTLNSQQLTTNKVRSEQLEVSSDATVSGTLRAGRILADNIEGLTGKIATLSSRTIINNTFYATSSATLSSGYASIASFSGQLAYVSNLQADTATFKQGVIALGPSSLMDTSVVGQLSINSSLVLANNSINVLGTDLEIQPLRQGGVSFLSGLIRIDSEGNLKVGGNAEFAKDVTVRGKLFAGLLSPIPDGDLVIQLATKSGNLSQQFRINNASGSAVLAVNNLGDIIASGSATVNKLKFNIVAPALALDDTNAIASGSAGVATISARQTQLTVHNPQVTDKSLIYITPVGSPNGQTPYLLRQVPNDPALSLPNGSFTTGIQLPSGLDTTFNWLIVN